MFTNYFCMKAKPFGLSLTIKLYPRQLNYKKFNINLLAKLHTFKNKSIHIIKTDSAYIDKDFTLEGAKTGPLVGTTFAVKDIFDVKGCMVSFGNPTWAATHPTSEETAPIIEKLLNAGAKLHGRCHMDEIAYSIQGENIHYGTPRNPVAPDRIPGGSSSGSAVCVANRDVEFSLGTDTAGSIRIPASYCGIYGIRPSHGLISLKSTRSLAPSFDVAGWFAYDFEIFNRVANVLLPDCDIKIKKILIGLDAFNIADKLITEFLLNSIPPNHYPIQYINVASCPTEGSLHDWFNVFRITQGYEVWQCHKDWITKEKPKFDPMIADRLRFTSKINIYDFEKAIKHKEKITNHIFTLLEGGNVLCIPTVASLPPKLKSSADILNDIRMKTITLCSIASLTGCPQITIPFAYFMDNKKFFVGLSFISEKGSDKALVQFIKNILIKL